MDQRPTHEILTVPVPEGVAGIEVMWKVLEILSREHGARVTEIDTGTESATALIEIPAHPPAA